MARKERFLSDWFICHEDNDKYQGELSKTRTKFGEATSRSWKEYKLKKL